MTDTTSTAVTRQAIAAQDRSLPGRVTGRLKRALDRMVWEGANRKDAAQASGMSDHSLRQALKRPHVIRYYMLELGIRRTSGRAKNLERLEALRDQDENKAAAVKAIQVLEQIDDDHHATAGKRTAMPGIVIVVGKDPVNVHAQAAPVTIEHMPYEPPALADAFEIEETTSDVSDDPPIDQRPSNDQRRFIDSSRRLAQRGMAPAPKRKFGDD